MGSVMIVILSILISIIVVLVLITLHELGHFIVAKLSKAYVFEFAIGFGPKLFVIKRKETWYSIRLIPLGGYVSIASDFAEPPKGREEEFEKIPDARKIDYAIKWKKTLFILFGPLINLFVAYILIFSVMFGVGYMPSDPNFYGQNFSTNSIAYKMIAEKEGIKPEEGNKYVSNHLKVAITGWNVQLVDKTQKDIKDWEFTVSKKESAPTYKEISAMFNHGKKEVYEYITKNNLDDQTIVKFQFEYLKLDNLYSGNLFLDKEKASDWATLEGTPISNWKKAKQITGIAIAPPDRYFKNGGQKLGYTFVETWNQSFSLLVGIGKFFTGDFSAISGPVGIAKSSIGTTTTATTSMTASRIFYVSSISANLFMLNMLPFPPLDGYKFWETLVEWVTKKEVSQKTKTIIYATGAILLISFIVVISIKDFII
ncbi:inner membrane zinc metalloprotease [Mesoplasma entomophilum]|uniref:Zinc metalloprotease n=2 Tax=Mesoplasma entomophilum TaxID=2149 RepID=A0A3S5XYU6_9MOLU|nr:RIP metalloprotease RseP [Mesoplasma entomophilum]ATZ19401.1 inner membrane zinc metalloprotease [Mesoplasma entomophilum]